MSEKYYYKIRVKANVSYAKSSKKLSPFMVEDILHNIGICPELDGLETIVTPLFEDVHKLHIEKVNEWLRKGWESQHSENRSPKPLTIDDVAFDLDLYNYE